MFDIVQPECEFAENPLGIDVRQPRFSWQVRHEQRGQAQTAYQITAASSLDNLRAGIFDLWDSGRTPVAASPLVAYAGVPLRSRQRVCWQVRAWDAHDAVSAYSTPAWFEMGLLEPSDWYAEWIGYPGGWNGQALYFRSPFTVEQAVQRARAYVCGLGWYEFRLNGHKVGDEVLNPAQTAYNKRVLYTTYDITGLVQTGLNVIGMVVGNGWHGSPKALAQLELSFADGSQQTVFTGRQGEGGTWWRVADGPIRENSVFNGEVYDARLEKTGWDVPAGDQQVYENFGVWSGVSVVEPPGGALAAHMLEPIRVVETRRPITIQQPQPNVFVLDTGQNLSGWARLTVQGAAGTAVTLRYAENLYPDGTVNQENLRTCHARDVYILKGTGVEVWEPRFTYHGFRYIQLEGFPGEPDLNTVEVRVVRSAVEPRGHLQTDHPLVNQLYQAVWWTEASNLHGLPTDCPQRDERMGWLNDMGARAEEAVYNFDLSRLLPKWIDDIADTQNAQGAIADTAPYRWGSRPADPVAVCYLLVPWLLYQHYGDELVLRDHYAGFGRWVDYLSAQAQDDVVTFSYFGDWSPPVAFGLPGSNGNGAVSRDTPGALVSTAHYYYSAALLARIAETLGEAQDAAVRRAQAQRIAESFNRHFWNEAAGGYGSNNQACNAIALYMGLVPASRRARVVQNLVHDVRELHQLHITTGNLATKFILEVLTDAGYGDIALGLVTQTTYPSWGYMLRNGATTIWERWEIASGAEMNSHSHPMYASVGAWLYRALGGLRLLPQSVGCSHLRIEPLPADNISAVQASLTTIKGTVSVNWRWVAPDFTFDLALPVGCEAEVVFPPRETPITAVYDGAELLWQPAGSARRTPGISEVHADDGTFMLKIGSGTYRLRAHYA